MKLTQDLVIIGAGPAGIKAAIAAAQTGLEVTLVENGPLPGGQYYKQLPAAVSESSNTFPYDGSHTHFSSLDHHKINLITGTNVWGIFPGTTSESWQVATHGPQGSIGLETRNVIVATGAYDCALPFPGWDLPGVITAGAALTMVKHQHILPGQRILLSGSGLLQFAAAANLVAAGANVIAVLEYADRLVWKGLPYSLKLIAQFTRIQEGLGYITNLVRTRTPYRFGWTVLNCGGKEQVEAVTIAKLDKNMRPVEQSIQTIPVDSVVLGYGLTPNTVLFRQIGCKMVVDEQSGFFVPFRNEFLETDLAGIYAVGDCAGIGGAPLAELEGKLAGQSVAYKEGKLTQTEFKNLRKADHKRYQREQQFAIALVTMFPNASPTFAKVDENTVICRCERITLAEVREAIRFGAQTVSDVKNITRAGMGNCQGRTCGRLIAHILSQATNRSLTDCGYLQTRPPIDPVPLASLETYNFSSPFQDVDQHG